MSHFRNFSLLALLVSCLLNGAFCQRDDTIVDGTPGKDVVDAVLRRIEGSGIFSEDSSFLARLAYVESRFGTANHTFRQDYYGGIWQVEESVFRITQTDHLSLTPLHAEIQTKFNINWKTVTWRRLMSPLYSGLAAALYFARVPEPIPQTIPGQAAHWKKYYRPLGELQDFEDASEDLRNRTRCRGKMDLIIVLDSSGSINMGDPLNYQRAKNFTAEVIESFTLDFTRMGMLVYSNVVRDIFDINNTHSISNMTALARNAVYIEQGTRTDFGILRAIEMFTNIGNAGGVPRVMTVLTDGNSDAGSNLPGAVDAIRNNSIKSLSIGIGNNINRDELLLIALNDSRSVFQLAEFNNLQDFLFQLTSVTCNVPQKPEINGTYADSLEQNEKRIYQMELPPVGITININITVGTTRGFWSLTEEVPSSAVYDGILDGSTYIPAPTFSRQQGLQQAAENPTVYFAIEGMEALNNYTIATIEGGKPEEIVTTTEEAKEEETTPKDEGGGDDNISTTTEAEGDQIVTTTDGGGASTIRLASTLSMGLVATYIFLSF